MGLIFSYRLDERDRHPRIPCLSKPSISPLQLLLSTCRRSRYFRPHRCLVIQNPPNASCDSSRSSGCTILRSIEVTASVLGRSVAYMQIDQIGCSLFRLGSNPGFRSSKSSGGSTPCQIDARPERFVEASTPGAVSATKSE